MGLKQSSETFALRRVFKYLEKNPEKNLQKILSFADKMAGERGGAFSRQRDVLHNIANDPENNMNKLAMSMMTEIDSGIIEKMFDNFFINASIRSMPKRTELREKYNINVPWAILLDPTSACNLHCTGCWAAEYGNKLNLSLEEIDDIIRQGEELGVYFYIYTGGEPLVRKKDLITICERHPDCEFLSFTNATLIDEAFADEMLRLKNFIPAISVEGFEEATDGRRGGGVYNKVIKAMELLKARHLLFGISCCYTSKNIDSISSEEFIDEMIAQGVRFIWYFHYMPVGNDAAPELLPSPEQREFMYHQIRHLRQTKVVFPLDFQNDGEFVGGCIAGGRRYFHINANGDCDPCVFIHYSDSNIREKTILEVLQSPLFKAYHDGQPFNDNLLRPCPMLENPEKLRELVEKTGAHSTDLESLEEVDHLCDKCVNYATNWKPTADKLWASTHPSANAEEKAEE